MTTKTTKNKKPSDVFYGTGRRKTSTAKVWLKSGSGQYSINHRPAPEYLTRETMVVEATRPLAVTGLAGKVDIKCLASGGGLASQAGAFAHGLSRALCAMNEDHRKPLKAAGLLRRDPRMKERKKYGRKRARRRFQFTKR